MAETKINSNQVRGGGGGTTNYDNLTNKPKVNGIVLSGNKTSADLGITTLTPFLLLGLLLESLKTYSQLLELIQ